MTLSVAIVLLALGLDLVYGVAVLLANRRRLVNRVFCGVTIVIALWLASVAGIIHSTVPEEARWWLTLATVFSSGIPTSFLMLRQAIRYPEADGRFHLRRLLPMMAVNAAIVAVILSPWFVREIEFPPASIGVYHVANPIYGPGFFLFAGYFLSSVAVLFACIARDVKHARGLQRMELQFVLLGATLGAALGMSLAILVPLFTGSSQLAQFAPLGSLAMITVVAHGIATRRAMDVNIFLRRITFYLLMVIYLSALYLGARSVARAALLYFLGWAEILPEMIAAVAVAFAMAPAVGWMQKFSHRLFHRASGQEISLLLRESFHALQSVSVLDDLFRRFADLVARALDAESVRVLLRERDGFVSHYPPHDSLSVSLTGESALVKIMEDSQEPFLPDTATRFRPTALSEKATHQMKSLDARMAVGVHGKEGLTAILLVGSRLSGRIYDRGEQDAVQTLCDQLAIAIENARLYTEVEAARRYHQTLVDRLPNGVIAVDNAGRLTVFNGEAERMTAIPATEAIGHGVERLPAVLRDALRAALESDRVMEDGDVEMVLREGGHPVPIHVGAAPVRAADGCRVGALIVFHDLTRLRALERQIRQQEDLARIGTLAAGLAHEIKNPLVTLKTFAQLLPRRHDDPDFRDNFAPLVEAEVQRIDRIVNQLLQLSRPVAPDRRLLHLHALLDRSLQVARRRIEGRPIRIEARWGAARDEILGDADLLVQTFEHFYTNSIEAMPEGTILVTTENMKASWDESDLYGRRPSRSVIRVTVLDTGPGIPKEDRARIFDPFFTRKASGTGLGLAVARRNILAHGGTVQVADRAGYGAMFFVDLPLAPEATP